MTHPRRWLFVATIAILLICFSPAPAGCADAVDPVWREKLRTEGRAAYEKYLAASRRMEENVEATKTDFAPDPGKSKTERRRVRCLCVDGCSLSERYNLDEPTEESPAYDADGENPYYRFTLTKLRAGDDVRLNRLYPKREDDFVPFLPRTILEIQLREFGTALKAADGTEKIDLVAVAEEPGGLLRVHFDDRSLGVLFQRTLWFDPRMNWRIERIHAVNASRTYDSAYTYGLALRGLDFPKSFSSVSHLREPGGERPESEYSFSVLEVKEADNGIDDFRLPAFGLSEPSEMYWKFFPERKHILAAVVAMSGVSALVWLRVRRRRRLKKSAADES